MKRYFTASSFTLFLSIFSLLYISVGVYAVHPHFHNQNDHHHEIISQVHEHGISGSHQNEAPCPVCDYLALLSADLPAGIVIEIPPLAFGFEGAGSIQPLNLLFMEGRTIRGPPDYLFS